MKTKTILAAILVLALGAENTYAQVIVSPDDMICLGDSTILTASGVMSGNLLQFDGVDDGVDVGNIGDMGTVYSVECWVKFSTITGVHFITTYRTSDQNNTSNIAFDIVQDNSDILFLIRDNSNTVASVSAFGMINTNDWFHIAGVRNGDTITLYVNGQNIGSNSAIFGTLIMNKLSHGTGWHDGSNIWVSHFPGQIDEVRIWNIARTQPEIASTINTTIAGNTPGLLAYWRFDECSGTTAADATGNGNNGTLMNNPAWVLPSTVLINPYSSYSWSPATGLSSTTGSTVTANPVTSTTYAVTIVGVDTTCTGQTAMVNVTVNPLPPKPTITQSGNDLASSPAMAYQWYYYDTLIIGATSQFYTAAQSGFYSVLVTDANGCSSTSDPYSVTISSIENIESIGSLNIYPNPNTGVFTIEMEIPKPKNLQLNIFNILGQTVYSETLNNIKGNYKKQIDMNPNPTGIYNLQILNHNNIMNRKIIMNNN